MSACEEFDVVIAGAGMVGMALAAALRDSGLRIALVDRAQASLPEARWHFLDGGEVELDARVSALTLATRNLLQRLGAWAHVPAARVCPYQAMDVWDGDGLGAIRFGAGEIHQDALGFLVENRFVAGALAQSLATAGHVEWRVPDTVVALRQTGSGSPEVELESGACLRGRLLVGADGANSAVRSLAALPVREWDYGHDAIAGTVRTEMRHERTAWQRFMADGPLAFLPLATEQHPDQYSSIVWSCVPERAEALMALDDPAFCRELGVTFEHRLGRVLFAGRRVRFPLRQRHATRYVQGGLALIGDAAHTIHPLAGQGVNLGFLDAAVLAEEILRGGERGLGPGDEHLLRRYQRRRMPHNLAMMGAMEGFKRLFGAEAPPLRWLRGTGLGLVNELRLPKQILMRQACGLDGDLPELARDGDVPAPV